MNAIGFDIGGTKIYTAYGEGETLHELLRFPTPQDLPSMLELFEYVVHKYSKEADCISIGIGLAGAKKPDGTLWVPNIPCLTGVNLEMLLEQRFGIKAVVVNDAHAALYGERWLGCAQNVSNAVLIAIGTGIGGAFLLDGQIVKGSHDAAGSLGWMTMKTDPQSNKMLHYEEVASGSALDMIARENGKYQSGVELLTEYRKGDTEAEKRFSCWASYLGYGIAAMASIMDVELIILTGGISQEYELFFPIIRDKIKTFASPLNQNAAVCLCTLGDKAGLYGALRLGQTLQKK